jgi:hypothetical protein
LREVERKGIGVCEHLFKNPTEHLLNLADLDTLGRLNIERRTTHRAYYARAAARFFNIINVAARRIRNMKGRLAEIARNVRPAPELPLRHNTHFLLTAAGT